MRAAYYGPGMDRAARDTAVICSPSVADKQRWGSGSAAIDCAPKATGGITSVFGACTANCVLTFRAEPSGGSRSVNEAAPS